MILLLLLALPILGAGLSLWFKRPEISLASIFTVSVLILVAYGLGESSSSLEDFWLLEYKKDWFYLGLDGLSFVLLLTSQALAALALIICWDKPKEHCFLLCTLAGLNGLLLSVDLLVFFIFWELMLLPVYFWVLSEGREKKNFAALQFIIFTQLSGLALLASVIAVFVFTGTTDSNQLLQIELPTRLELWIGAGFILAFLIKLPAFPFHTWMPSLFDNAPLAAVISSLLLKTGAYGFLRFVLPLFPTTTITVAPFMMCLGAISVVFGAVLAFSQKNSRKVLAYSTLSHAGLMLMGLFSNNLLAINGVIVLMITQGLATAGLFISLELHLGFTLFFVMASLGLPGLGNFIGEWLLLFGLFQQNPWAAMIGSLSLILGAAYMLRLIIQLYYGPQKINLDFSKVKYAACALTAFFLLWIGLFPAVLLDLTVPAWKEDNNSAPEEPEQENTPQTDDGVNNA